MNAADDETKEFDNWLDDRKGGSSTFKYGDKDDKKLAHDLRRQFRDEAPGKSDEEKADLRKQLIEQFRQQNSHSRKIGDIMAGREKRLADQKKVQDKFAEQIKNVQENGATGFVLTDRAQKGVERSKKWAGRAQKAGQFMASADFKGVVKFAGDNLKLIGGSVGLDNLVDKIKGENSVIDRGKLVIRDFGQHLGVNSLADKKTFLTVKEREDYDKEEIQTKVVDDTGVKESQDMITSINNLEKAWKGYKTKK